MAKLIIPENKVYIQLGNNPGKHNKINIRAVWLIPIFCG